MKHTSLLVLLCAASLLVVSSGCKHKQSLDSTLENDDIVGVGDMVGGADEGFGGETVAMPGASFQTLPRITDVSFSPVYFGYNNYQLNGAEYSKMDAVAAYLQNNDRAVLVVEGHCDERGTEEYNMSLGEYRAQSVRSYLMNAGVDADRVQTTSFGKTRPAVAGSGESAWSLNRRGEFALYQR